MVFLLTIHLGFMIFLLLGFMIYLRCTARPKLHACNSAGHVGSAHTLLLQQAGHFGI